MTRPLSADAHRSRPTTAVRSGVVVATQQCTGPHLAEGGRKKRQQISAREGFTAHRRSICSCSGGTLSVLFGTLTGFALQ